MPLMKWESSRWRETGVAQVFAQAIEIGSPLGVAGSLVGGGLLWEELRLVSHWPFSKPG